ncbi:hypothetical protein B0H16DRAFT_1777689 [Mycena metata]|uniref:Uncharacterized protein n=1 Tax=Mycena metata TaxID=1033252 RepID=A0AAD7HUN0_9AGAR|nr:hypothetical protein B0H16DRAFT_1777689 [Mycena metata]
MYFRYSGFTDFKCILLRATIAFLTNLSKKQISKQVLLDEGVALAAEVEGVDEGIFITNYRARITEAIKLLQSWMRAPGVKGPSAQDLFGILPPRPPPEMLGMLDRADFIAQMMGEIPILFDKVEAHATPPHTLKELRIGGIHSFLKLADNNDSVGYEQAKEIAAVMRKAKPYCEWGDNWGPTPEEMQAAKENKEKLGAVSDEKSTEEDGDKKPTEEDGGKKPTEEDGGKKPTEDGGIEEEDEEEDEDYEEEDEVHFIDEIIGIFEACPPGGTICD